MPKKQHSKKIREIAIQLSNAYGLALRIKRNDDTLVEMYDTLNTASQRCEQHRFSANRPESFSSGEQLLHELDKLIEEYKNNFMEICETTNTQLNDLIKNLNGVVEIAKSKAKETKREFAERVCSQILADVVKTRHRVRESRRIEKEKVEPAKNGK